MMTDELIDDLVAALDECARDHDHYEYGLPLYSRREEMRQIVRLWLVKIQYDMATVEGA